MNERSDPTVLMGAGGDDMAGVGGWAFAVACSARPGVRLPKSGTGTAPRSEPYV